MKKGIDYIGVGSGAIIFNRVGKVFLAKRGREARNESGKWEFSGGGVEFGERLEDALVREVREEYGLGSPGNAFLIMLCHNAEEMHP